MVVSRCLINFAEFLLRETVKLYFRERGRGGCWTTDNARSNFIWFVRRSIFRDSEWPLTRQTNAVNSRCKTAYAIRITLCLPMDRS